jgi:DNA-binding XRE family transcriptional regulator
MNRKKSKSKGRQKRVSSSKKRSFAAKKGWQTRRHNAFIAREVKDLRDQLEKSKKELAEVGVQRDTLKDEIRTIKETGEISGGMHFPPKRHRPRRDVVKEFMNRAVRLYGKEGPGLLDTAHDLAEYYEVEINDVFNEWYEEVK